MKANWAVIALALFILIACLASPANLPTYDAAPVTAFDPSRPIRTLIMQPLYDAASALAATDGW